ncbi:AMP-binding protein, partial [Rhodococcus rhodochrous]|uniref:AMP-binding protein n=1 Tax=Rhodococcus rhodochrous TaxID=1829 RepID=UPI003FCEEEF2
MTEQFSFETLTPTAFLDRSARVFRDDLAMVDGDVRRTYAELRDRCLRQSGMLHALGVEPGDRVAVLAPNTSLMLEAHYGVLYAGAVLVSLNTRLTAPELRFILEHSGSRVLLVEESLADLAREATADLPSITVVGDDYEDKLAAARHRYVPLADERTMIALNYTSGTTGDPKGVMYHARGAYLQALAMVAHFGLDSGSTCLWTLPMFHCNGWT